MSGLLTKTPLGDVPCGGCTLCCRGDVIMLFPEKGDDVDSYETEEWTIPGTAESGRVIRKGADGNCFYLGASGCTIHDRAPLICRTFDCRAWFRNHSRIERRRMVKSGLAGQAIFDRGRELLPTLATEEEIYNAR